MVEVNFTNKRFGLLYVLKATTRDSHGKKGWLVRCDCGIQKIVETKRLTEGKIKSCGCLTLSNRKSFGDSRRGKPSAIALPPGEAAMRRLMSRYKADAARRNFQFTLTRDEFKELTSDLCFYCGKPPLQVQKPGKGSKDIYRYNGIDRVNNCVGYVKQNCVPCCSLCNTRKGALDFYDFAAWVSKVALSIRRSGLF